MGQEMSRSSVLICVSHGAITGETEVDVKNMVIATNPGMRNAAGKSRPMEKARNRKRGNKMPNNRTGPLK
jgi:phage terminase large subunit-like protein